MKRANDDLDAFDYLTSGIVDVAFVNLKAIEKSVNVGELRGLFQFTNVFCAFSLLLCITRTFL